MCVGGSCPPIPVLTWVTPTHTCTHMGHTHPYPYPHGSHPPIPVPKWVMPTHTHTHMGRTHPYPYPHGSHPPIPVPTWVAPTHTHSCHNTVGVMECVTGLVEICLHPEQNDVDKVWQVPADPRAGQGADRESFALRSGWGGCVCVSLALTKQSKFFVRPAQCVHGAKLGGSKDGAVGAPAESARRQVCSHVQVRAAGLLLLLLDIAMTVD